MVIRLNRFMGQSFILNADLIEVVEETPNTVVTLVNGKKYVVEETLSEVVDKVESYKHKIIKGPSIKRL